VRDLCADLLPNLLKRPQRDRAIPGVSVVRERRVWVTHAHVESTVGVLQRCGFETELVTYNAEDCEALERVTTAVTHLCQGQDEAAQSPENTILTFPYRDFSEYACGLADDTP